MSLEHVAIALPEAAWRRHFAAPQSTEPPVELQLIGQHLSVGTHVALYGAPDCLVVDCVPWTRGVVTAETLLVLLPPHQLPLGDSLDAAPPHQNRPTTVAPSVDDGRDDGLALLATFLPDGGHVDGAVAAPEGRRGMVAMVDPDVLLELGVGDGALVCIANAVYFEVRQVPAPPGCANHTARTFQCTHPLWLALHNWHRSIAPPSTAQRRGSDCWGALTLPLNAVAPVWHSDLAPLPPNVDDAVVNVRGSGQVPPDDAVDKLMTVKKVLLVPAMHAQWMASVFGPKHADLLEGLLKAAVLGGWLHNQMVFEDAVVSIPLHTGVGASVASDSSSLWTEWLQRCEASSTTARAAAKQCGTQYFPHQQLYHGIPMRVALVATDGALPVGYVRTAANGPTTEVLLGASSGNATLLRDEGHLAASPPRPPVPLFCVQAGTTAATYPYLRTTRGTRSVADFLNGFYATHRGLPVGSHNGPPCGVAVVFGSCENLVLEQALTALECCGLQSVVHDMRTVSDWKVVADTAEALAAEPAPQTLVVRHAQRGVNAANFHLFCEFAHSEGQESSPTAPAKPVYPVAVMLLVETNDAQCPVSLSALSSVPPIRVAVPSDEDRETVLRSILTPSSAAPRWRLSRFLSFTTLQQWTVGLPLADVVAYAQTSLYALVHQRSDGTDSDALPVLGSMGLEDALKHFQRVHGHNLASTKLQPVRWSDVGGLEEAKQEIMDTIQLPILHPELFANGTKRRAGILLYGPPGCGKTLIAKAVATELNINFISVKGPELINQYVGESERNVRNLFQRARDSAPCIVFFDELDALVPARGAKGDAGGAMDRIVAQLLVEVDGVGTSGPADAGQDAPERPKEIFIIGATNRPDLLDPALLRPGRFDRLCYLGLPSTKDEQLFAIRALTRKFALSSDVDLAEVVRPLDFVFTGADFFALCSDAMMLAVDDVVAQARALIDAQQGSGDASADSINEAALPESVVVSQSHFLAARGSLKASVTQNDLRRYEALKSTFNKR